MEKKYTDITFKTFTQTFIRNFSDGFQYQETPVQVYTLEELYSKNIATPLPLLKADFHYIVILNNGNFEQQVGLEIKKVAAGQALLVVQGEVSALLRKSQDVQGFYIIFEDRVLQQFKENTYFLKLFTTSPSIQLGQNEKMMVNDISRLIIQEFKTGKANASIVLLLLQSLLLKLLQSSESKKGLSRQFDIAVSFRTLVLKHHGEELSIEDYAKLMNISSNYLNRCVKAVWDKSAKLLTQEIIIIQSQNLLADFSKSISDVAYQMNFNDPSYYGRLFKKIIGISPQVYRTRIMHDSSG